MSMPKGSKTWIPTHTKILATDRTKPTKEQIIDVLGRKAIRLKDISRAIERADSTVKLHLIRLMQAGRVKRYNNYYYLVLKG